MGKKLGNEYMLWLESATAGTYNLIKGQGNLTINRGGGEVDLSSKDDGGYGASAPGMKKWSIDVAVIPNLPDASGYTRAETLANAAVQAPVNIQIRKGGTTGGPTDVVFAGSAYSQIASTGFDQDAGVSTPFKFLGNGAPTTDALA